MGAITSALGSIDPTGSGNKINASMNRDIIGGDPSIARQRDADYARLQQLAGQSGDETLAKYGRTIDSNAFAPVFGGTAQMLDARSAGADATGARNVSAGGNVMLSAAANLQNTSTAGIAGAAAKQGQSADLLARQYAGGTDPSAAQAQLQQGTDAALRAQLAAARSGGNPAAGYQAQLAGAQTLQQAANQAAQLRAQEQQAVRSDMLAAQGASTAAQTGLVDTRSGLQSAAAGIGANLASLGTTQQQRADSLTGQAAGLRDADRTSAQNLEQMKSQELSGARAFQTGLSSGMSGITQAKTEAEAARMQRATGLTGNIIGGVAKAFMSDARSKEKIRKLEAENSMLRDKTPEQSAALDYLDTIGQTDEDKDDEARFLARHEYGTQRPAYDAQQTSLGIYDPWGADAPRRAPSAPASQGYAFAPLSGPWVTSDERAKKNVDAMFSAVEPKTFEYRDGYGPPGRREGFLADDLERTPLGRSLVSRDPETGMRQVDTGQLTAANTAEIKLLRDEIEALKKGGSRGR